MMSGFSRFAVFVGFRVFLCLFGFSGFRVWGVGGFSVLRVFGFSGFQVFGFPGIPRRCSRRLRQELGWAGGQTGFGFLNLWSFRVIACHSVSFRAIPCRSVPFRVVPCHSVSFRVVPCRSVSFRVIPCHSVSFRVVFELLCQIVHLFII